MSGFDFEENCIKTEIAKLGAKRVLLQMPQGLKPQATKIAKIIEQTGALPIVSVDPCYGVEGGLEQINCRLQCCRRCHSPGLL